MYVKYDETFIHIKTGFAWPFVRPESLSAWGKEAVIVQLMQSPGTHRGYRFIFIGIYNCLNTHIHTPTSALGWMPLQTGSVCWAFWPACNGWNTACDQDQASGTHEPHCRPGERRRKVRTGLISHITWCTCFIANLQRVGKNNKNVLK